MVRKILPDYEILRLYILEDHSVNKLAKMFRVDNTTIDRVLRDYNVDKRGIKEANKLRGELAYKDKACSICGKDVYLSHNGVFYCAKHYSQIMSYGKILTRTKFDPNEIIIHEDCCELHTYDINHNVNGVYYFDLDDYDLIKKT